MAQRALAVDVGNSRVKFGLFECDVPMPELIQGGVVVSGEDLPWHSVLEWTQDDDVLQCYVAGSDPTGVEALCHNWPSVLTAAQVIDRNHDLSVNVYLDEPERVGLDRLLTATAVNAQRESGRSAIVVDSGTATTVDLISSSGVFEGGAILPGLALSAEALHRYTALLPFVPVDEFHSVEPDAIGRNTRSAIQSGLLWGHLGAIRNLVDRMSSLRAAQPQLFLTGGAARVLHQWLTEFEWHPYLALQGIVLAGRARD